MWTPEETVMTYTVNCPLGEYNTSFLQQNESSVIFQVRSYSNLNVCLTAGNICNNQVTICTEVFPASITPPAPPMTSRLTESSMRTSTAISVNGNVTTLELRLPSTLESGMFLKYLLQDHRINQSAYILQYVIFGHFKWVSEGKSREGNDFLTPSLTHSLPPSLSLPPPSFPFILYYQRCNLKKSNLNDDWPFLKYSRTRRSVEHWTRALTALGKVN